jgi:hypothetical protein
VPSQFVNDMQYEDISGKIIDLNEGCQNVKNVKNIYILHRFTILRDVFFTPITED